MIKRDEFGFAPCPVCSKKVVPHDDCDSYPTTCAICSGPCELEAQCEDCGLSFCADCRNTAASGGEA